MNTTRFIVVIQLHEGAVSSLTTKNGKNPYDEISDVLEPDGFTTLQNGVLVSNPTLSAIDVVVALGVLKSLSWLKKSTYSCTLHRIEETTNTFSLL
jgi:virulence-associated protein VapD